ncbi:hypothetical protein FDC58_17655 [Clostridium botulinum]|nr:hypothetical protein [Clostridium botulinum]NFP31016.1 hypothetical protein [Clostridium botulinum]
MKIESIDILEITKDDGRIEQFRRGSIVGIIDKQDKYYIGKINFVDTESLEIDASKKFESNIKSIKYKDIESIKLIDKKKGI